MTKSFDEWFKKRHSKTGLYEDALRGDADATYFRHEMRKSYLTGQQSKQDEIEELQKRVKELELINFDSELHFDAAKEHIDHLQKRVDRAVEHIEDYYGVVGLSMIVDILKGEETK